MKKILFAVIALSPFFATAYTQPLSTGRLTQELAQAFYQAQISLQYNPAPASNFTSANGPAAQIFRQYSPAPAAMPVQQVKHNANIPPITSSWPATISKHIAAQTQKHQKKSVSYGKPWQIALFLAAPDRPINETLGTLRWSIRRGYIRQAAVLDLSPANKNRNYDFYLIYAHGSSARTQHISISAKADINILLEELTKHLQRNNDLLQTGIIIDAHGSSEEIFFDRNTQDNDSFTLPQLLASAERINLHIDALQVISCHSGTISNIYQMARRVDFVIISSDIAMGDAEQFYYSLIQYAPYSAKKAAKLAATWHMRMHSPWAAGEDAVNAMSLDLKNVTPQLDKWGKTIMELCGNTKEYASVPTGDKVISFRNFASKKIHDIKKGNIAAICHPEKDVSARQINNVITAGEELLAAMDNAIMAQWCQPPNQSRFITGNFTANGCTNGPSVNDTAWKELWNIWNKKHEQNTPKLVRFRI